MLRPLTFEDVAHKTAQKLFEIRHLLTGAPQNFTGKAIKFVSN
jgi:hypothetical protein